MSKQHRVLIVMTSHGDLGGLRPTGVFVSEAAEPWAEFTQAGCRVDVATVAGGRPPFDGFDEHDATQRRFVESVDLDGAPALADVHVGDYDAIFFAGGHGTMWDFVAPVVGEAAAAVWAAGGVVAAVCHGPSALVSAVTKDGRPLVAGRRVTGFTNEEEHLVKLETVVPFLLADRLTELDARFEAGAPFTEHVVIDGRLITGQNPQSAAATAEAVLEELDAEDAAKGVA